MTHKSACGTDEMSFLAIDNAAIASLQGHTRTALGELPDIIDKTFVIGNRVLAASGVADGQKGCVTIPVFGVPIEVCWEFEEFNLNLPSVSMKIGLTAAVAGTPYLAVDVTIKCDNVADPAGCKVQVTPTGPGAVAARTPSCDWGCFRSCAPGCISCATDYFCWAACAVGCVSRCCSLF